MTPYDFKHDEQDRRTPAVRIVQRLQSGDMNSIIAAFAEALSLSDAPLESGEKFTGPEKEKIMRALFGRYVEACNDKDRRDV